MGLSDSAALQVFSCFVESAVRPLRPQNKDGHAASCCSRTAVGKVKQSPSSRGRPCARSSKLNPNQWQTIFPQTSFASACEVVGAIVPRPVLLQV